MFRAQQNAFDDVVGKHILPSSYELAWRAPSSKAVGYRIALMINLYSQGDRREPHLRELGVYYGCLRQGDDRGQRCQGCGGKYDKEVGASKCERTIVYPRGRTLLGPVHQYLLIFIPQLANALSQNCGVKMHRELASRAFTEALLRLANDRNTHQQVKAKILERMQEWAEMFKDPDLGIMNDQYHKLKSQNPNLHPPSAPSKSRLTDVDRQKEEEELQMALKLSIQEKTPQSQSQAKPAQPATLSAAPSQPQPAAQAPVASGTTAASVSRVRALFDFQATDPDELTFRKGDIIAVLESVYKDWWKGLLRGQTGIFPLNYVEKLADPTQEELQREAQMEAEVFAEIKNVEKLLTLLSTSTSDLNVRDNDEITVCPFMALQCAVTNSGRPSITRHLQSGQNLLSLSGSTRRKKVPLQHLVYNHLLTCLDDFTQLNERFIKSCRDYENLLDASMTQAQPAYQYGRQGHGYAGGYPPQSAPPQQNPQRFYSPNQTNQQQGMSISHH